MRLTVITCGSEGDTRPLAALCRGLMDHGHDVRLFADQATLTGPRSLGVPCEALQGDIRTLLPQGDPRQELRLSDVLGVVRAMRSHVSAHSAAWLRAAGAHARGSDAILFCGLARAAGLILGEELRKPAIGLALQPAAPTREFSSPGMRPMQLPGWLNKWTHGQSHHQLWRLLQPGSSQARLEVFGSRAVPRPTWDFPVLYGVSRELVPQPQDWPPGHVICGHWCHPMTHWQPPGDLQAFLEGEPPLYVGFGSASAFVRGRALRTLMEAVAGHRVVFSPGWSHIDQTLLPPGFHLARDVPHEWLFPRVRLVIHHGGAGTTHTAARASVPQVILPFGADQPFWARRIALRGAGPDTSRGLPRNAAGLARLIASAQAEPTRRKAKELGQAMAQEDAVGRAVCELEAILGRG